MKKYIGILILLCVVAPNSLFSQADRDSSETVVKKIYVITTNSGGEFVGVILKEDAREVLIKTKDKGEVIIPKFEIRVMKELGAGELSSKGEFMSDNVFSTRYFFTTNGLPIKKGESYVLWNLYGPEVHFGVSKNLSLGIMTSWVGIPIVGSAKYSIKLGENLNLGVGLLAGTGSWAAPDFLVGLPYGALTFGNRRNNINFSGGYGMAAYDGYQGGVAVYSVGALARIGKKASFVLDSFFYVEDNFSNNSGIYGIIIPGIRLQTKYDAAFQFGFSGFYGEGQFIQVPIPMLGWFKKL
ncbi:MAG: hypothetical protein P1U41_03040 [Vicingaceae bacterium]|nr:hypothetical protein [Vicingaceae bacterium]